MTGRHILWIGLGAVALLLGAGAIWILTLPPEPAIAAPDAIDARETESTIEALKPPKRQRPLIAIIGINDATEVTDYLMPYGILRRADVADVVALATGAGPVTLYQALTVEPQATTAEFDAQHPDGADYVLVPAMSRDNDSAALQWIRSQASKGAIVIGVCAGAKVVGAAGLLEGKRATTHWYYLDALRKANPGVRYVADRRFVVDQGIATTTGITASMPLSLTLIEAIAGRDRAEAVARDLGVVEWDARHASGAFRFNRSFAITVIGNVLAVWNRDKLGIELTPGMDEVALALVVDAWSRTYRSRALTFAHDPGPVTTRNGIRVIPDRIAADWPADRRLPPIGNTSPAQALDQTLLAIERRYGSRTAAAVAMQLEYPRRGTRMQ